MERQHRRILEKVTQAGQLQLRDLSTEEMTAAADLVAEGLLDYQQRRDAGSRSTVVYGYLTKQGKHIAAQLEVEDEEGMDLTQEFGLVRDLPPRAVLVEEGLEHGNVVPNALEAVVGRDKCPTCKGELVDVSSTHNSEVMELLCVLCGEIVYVQDAFLFKVASPRY